MTVAFYGLAAVGAYEVGEYGALAVRCIHRGDPIWVFHVSVAVICYFASKDMLSKCREAMGAVRRKLELRRA